MHRCNGVVAFPCIVAVVVVVDVAVVDGFVRRWVVGGGRRCLWVCRIWGFEGLRV